MTLFAFKEAKLPASGQEIIIAGFSLSVVVLGLIQAIKLAVNLQGKYVPILSIFIGALLAVVFGVLSGKVGAGLFEYFIAGVMAGQMATGTYSSVKKWVNGNNKPQ